MPYKFELNGDGENVKYVFGTLKSEIEYEINKEPAELISLTIKNSEFITEDGKNDIDPLDIYTDVWNYISKNLDTFIKKD